MKIFIIFILSLFFLNSCGIYKKTDARQVSPNATDRVKKNMEEGKTFRLSNMGGGGGTNFEFASSNPIWRASLDVLDFAPLVNANYSGGIIITDWITGNEVASGEAYKITIKFLTNEIRSDALKISIHEKSCNINNQCKTSEIENSNIKQELSKKILRIATLYENEDIEKIKEEVGEYRSTED